MSSILQTSRQITVNTATCKWTLNTPPPPLPMPSNYQYNKSL